MSDTPETDAKASPHIGFYSCATVPAEFARKLERERNVALEQWELCIGLAKKNERERDEALEALENHMASTVHSCSDECKRPMCVLRRQRDDAREMVKAICKNKFGTNCEFIDDDEQD